VTLTPAQQQALATWYATKQAAAQAGKALAESPLALAVQKATADLAASPLAVAARAAYDRAAAAEVDAQKVLAPVIREGTHTIDLSQGWGLKTSCTYTRKIDQQAVESLRTPLAVLATSLDRLLRWKVELETKEYRELTAEARAVFDTCITTTPGVPKLEIVPPKVQP
jgi:hypothetical protein